MQKKLQSLRGRIVGRAEAGQSPRQIRKGLQHAKCTVWAIVDKFKNDDKENMRLIQVIRRETIQGKEWVKEPSIMG